MMKEELLCWLSLLITYELVRSASKIFSIKGECSFLFLNFLIIGLSSANSRVGKSKRRWFEVFSFLIPLPEAFYEKNYSPL